MTKSLPIATLEPHRTYLMGGSAHSFKQLAERRTAKSAIGPPANGAPSISQTSPLELDLTTTATSRDNANVVQVKFEDQVRLDGRRVEVKCKTRRSSPNATGSTNSSNTAYRCGAQDPAIATSTRCSQTSCAGAEAPPAPPSRRPNGRSKPERGTKPTLSYDEYNPARATRRTGKDPRSNRGSETQLRPKRGHTVDASACMVEEVVVSVNDKNLLTVSHADAKTRDAPHTAASTEGTAWEDGTTAPKRRRTTATSQPRGPSTEGNGAQAKMPVPSHSWRPNPSVDEARAPRRVRDKVAHIERVEDSPTLSHRPAPRKTTARKVPKGKKPRTCMGVRQLRPLQQRHPVAAGNQLNHRNGGRRTRPPAPKGSKRK